MNRVSSRKRTHADFIDQYATSAPKRPNVPLNRTHPLGVKPLGNYFVDCAFGKPPDIRTPGLGCLARLTDELLLELLVYLSPHDLLSFGATSRVLYCFTYMDDLWRQLTLSRLEGNWRWEGTWRLTYLKSTCKVYQVSAFCLPAARAPGLYSDALFQSFLCANVGVNEFVVDDDCISWQSGRRIERRADLSLTEFVEKYEKPNRPVIITDIVTQWPAYRNWSMQSLVERFGDCKFRAESVDITLRQYVRYAADTNDESPLYLFDRRFGETCEELANDYDVPEYFREDFFRVFGGDRPDYRWIVIGPARSGSTFHKDPNSTSAWNAVITGSKKWIMFPPDVLPPGVFVNDDESEVTSPVSLIEWYLNYYEQALKHDPPPVEAVVHAGELIFVPNGWWHLVVNLEETIAITQNYVGSQNLLNVLRFMRDKPSQISGFNKTSCVHAEKLPTSIYERFRSLFCESHPGVLERLEQEAQNDSRQKTSMWDRLKKSANGTRISFGFAFAEPAENECEGEKDY